MINGHFRPYRSAARPKMILPTERSMSTRVIPQVISNRLVSVRSGSIGLTFLGFPEALCKILNCQRYSEEIKGIPGPCEESNQKEQPLFKVQKSQECNGVLYSSHRRFQRGNASCEVTACAHHFLWSGEVLALFNAILLVSHSRYVFETPCTWRLNTQDGVSVQRLLRGFELLNGRKLVKKYQEME
jgi:hypothetical protein